MGEGAERLNKCVFYIQATHGIHVCKQDAPFMVNGSSFCGEHVNYALDGVTWKVMEKKGT
jgi:hypothetical protein